MPTSASPTPAVPTTAMECRLDKFLWVVRAFRTRALALAAIHGGHILVDGQVPKPARNVRMGDTIVILDEGRRRVLRVVGLGEQRVGAKLVPTLVDDITPPEERERPRDLLAPALPKVTRGEGRPTKRDRRDWADAMGEL